MVKSDTRRYNIITIICMLMIIVVLGILVMLALVIPISATLDDVKNATCNSINLTESNCTTWWDTLNLTEDNFIDITVQYIINETIYLNETHKNFYYNYSYNESIIYNKTEIDNIFNGYTTLLQTDNKIGNAIAPDLNNYVLKENLGNEINLTLNQTTFDIKVPPVWKTMILINLMFIILLICGVVILFMR